MIVKFLNKYIKGMLLLKDYPNKILKELINQNPEILFIVDENKDINLDVIKVSTAKMAEYRNKDIDKPIVFITDELIDTFSDINSIDIDDLNGYFDEIFDIDSEIKSFVKKIQTDIFTKEKFIKNILTLIEKGFDKYSAVGLSLDILGIFKCEKCFKKLDIKILEQIESAFEKRDKNKIIENEKLLEKYEKLNLNNKLLKEFILANFDEIIKNRDKYTKLDYQKDLVYKLFEKEKKTSKKLGALIVEELQKDDIENEEISEFLLRYDKLKIKEREAFKNELIEICNKPEIKIIIENNEKIYKEYEKEVYKDKIDTNDFLDGLLTILEGVEFDEVIVKLDKKQKNSIIKNYSFTALDYFQKNFLMINNISKKIKIDWTFIDKAEEKNDKKSNTLKFNIFIIKDGVERKKRLNYFFENKAIISAFTKDLITIQNNSLFSAEIESEEFNLKDKKSYKSDAKGDRLYASTSKKFSLYEIKKSCNEFEFDELYIIFDKFEKEYLEVISNLENLNLELVEKLKNSYLKILKFLNEYKNNDEVREKIIDKFLLLGAIFNRKSDNILLTPFHILNLINEFYKKVYIFNMLDNANNLVKKDLFFEEMRLISKTTFIETINNYTLRDKLDGYLFFDTSYITNLYNKDYENIFLKITEEYKKLYPYKNKIKILLYEIKDKEFIINFINHLQGEFEIDIYDNFNFLQKTYKEFLKENHKEEQFLSQKEINILTELDKNKKFDIVFFNDYITKFTKKEFLESEKKVSLKEYSPLIFSKKKAVVSDDYDIGSFLLSPLKNELYLFFKIMYKTPKLPAILVNKKDSNLESLKEIHTLSNWIVNIDSIIDKTLLKELKANVIKYKKDKKTNKNIIISSKANRTILIERIDNKLRELNIYSDNVENILDEVNEISGDLLLKAYSKGSFTNELIGIYLSKKVLEGKDKIFIYIDDYKEYFSASSDVMNAKKYFSDLLVIKPIFEDKILKELNIAIIESKFTNQKELIEKSLKQTQYTYNLFKKFLSKEYVDSEIFISKLSNIIVEVVEDRFSNGLNSAELREQIIFNEVKFNLSAKSFVFMYESNKSYEEEFLKVFSTEEIKEIFEGKKVELEFEKIEKKVQVVNELTNDIKVKKEENFEKIKESIKTIFHFHNLSAVIKNIKTTPNSIIVSLKPVLGYRANEIEKKVKDDFLMSEELELLRVESIKGALNLVFKKDTRDIVKYKDLIKNRELSEGYGNTKILIGVDERSGEIVYYDLNSEDPHALVGGMTKSGKSVLLSEIIVDLISTNKLNELELILIDPKKVEFTIFEDSKYVKEVVTKKEKATQILDEIVAEMEKRYDKIREYKTKNINQLYEKTGIKFKRIVVIFDEVADWMVDKDFKKEVEEALNRLSSKARAAGIHLIIATQRPDNTIISPILRANLGAKFALKVDSEKNSKIILDEEGAEKLLGYGHILAKFNGEKHYIQGAYLSEDEIEEYIRNER